MTTESTQYIAPDQNDPAVRKGQELSLIHI